MKMNMKMCGSFFTIILLFQLNLLRIVKASSEPRGCQVDISSDSTEAIPLLLSDESGLNMVLCGVGLKYLREELGDKELYITSVVGPARKGKSFLLNNMAQISQEEPLHDRTVKRFSVGHTAHGHTKGFWLSKSKHNAITDESGKEVTAIFMDTEGSGATGNFKSYDPKICAIASIFSSNLIYNVMSEISMDNLDFLAKITLFDNYLTQKKNTSFPSPPLSWAVQNWEFSLDSYDPPNEIRYLRSVLQKKDLTKNLGHDERKQYEEYNDLISAITEKFSPFDDVVPRSLPPIILFDQPSQKTKKMDLTDLSFSEYDEGYQRQIVELRKKIRDGAKPKEFSKGKYLTGKTFAQNLETLTVALNQLTHVGDALIKAVAKESADISFDEFKNDAARIPQPSQSQVRYNDQLLQMEERYMKKFQNGCLGNDIDSTNVEVRDQLLERIKGESRILQELNFNRQLDRCARVVTEHVVAIKNVSSANNRFNRCGLSALVKVENDSSTKIRKNDRSHEKLLQLHQCYESNAEQYARKCSPSWCDSSNIHDRENCVEPLTRTLNDYTDRSNEAFGIQKKELSLAGFQKLFFTIIVSYCAFYICSIILPGSLGRLFGTLKTLTYPVLVFLFVISNFQTYKWLQESFCYFIEDWLFVESTMCIHYSDELPNTLGSHYNTLKLYFSKFSGLFFVVMEKFKNSENKKETITSFCLALIKMIGERTGIIEEAGEDTWMPEDINSSDLLYSNSNAMTDLIVKAVTLLLVSSVTIIILRKMKK